MQGRGINAHVASKSDVDKVVACGCEWIRIDFDWRTIEPSRGSYKWSAFDNAVNYAKQKGLKTYVTLAYVPTWVNADHRACPDVSSWITFVTKVAIRYGTKIDAYSLWNEPNLKRFYIGSKEEYVKTILEAGHNAIKSVNPNLIVAAGDLATVSGSHWPEWFKLLKKHTDLFDVFSWHVYQKDADAVIARYAHGKCPVVGWLIPKWQPYKWAIDDIRKKNKRVFLTETGLKARDSKYSELKDQRDFVRKLDKIRKETKSEVVFVYDLKDYAVQKDKWGVFSDNGNPKLAAQWMMENN